MPLPPEIRLRALAPSDRPALERLLRATLAFTEEEVLVALELIDLGLAPGGGGYRFLVAEVAGSRVGGYACFGATPLARGVFDLYWIVVDPELQGRGLGRKLLAAVEESLRREQARLLLVETASKPSYAATRAFYDRVGLEEVARVPDFYEVGDDKIIYARRL